MASSAVTWSLQNFVLAKVKTVIGNDPDTLSLTSSLIVALIGYLSYKGPLAYEKFVRWLQCIFKKFRKDGFRFHTCYIPKTCPDESGTPQAKLSDGNTLYTSVTWFISENIDCRERMTAYNELEDINIGAKDRLKILPAINAHHKMMYDDTQISFTFINEESGDSDRPNKIGVQISMTNLNKMKKFLADCKKSYEEDSKKKAWRQQVYTHHGRGRDLQWSAELSYNSKLWNTVVLPAQTKKDLMQDLDLFMDSEFWYTQKGLPWNRGIILAGRPGCGKTSIIKAISNQYKMHIFNIRLHMIQDDDDMNLLFKKIPARSVVVMEDIDAMDEIVHSREKTALQLESLTNDGDQHEERKPKKSHTFHESKVTLAGVLNVLDGVAGSHGRITIMTTNHKDRLDAALLRPGRCDIHLDLKNCTNAEIDEFFKVFTDDSCPRSFPDHVLSPAQVSNVLLTHRKDNEAAVKELQRLVDRACPGVHKSAG